MGSGVILDTGPSCNTFVKIKNGAVKFGGTQGFVKFGSAVFWGRFVFPRKPAVPVSAYPAITPLLS